MIVILLGIRNAQKVEHGYRETGFRHTNGPTNFLRKKTKKDITPSSSTRSFAPRKRDDSVRSYDELEVEEEASVISGSFVFPPPPPLPSNHNPRRPVSASSYSHSISDSDSQSESSRGVGGQSSPITICHPMFTFRGYQSDGSPAALHSLPGLLPPIGVFWDIENCQVPKGKSALAVAQVIRDKFFSGYREAEFLVVCDVKKENSQVIQELNDAQVNLIHVASTCKNAADDKLRQSIRRFADIHHSPAAIILISGDINFAADLTDLRHRKKFHVILLHNNIASEALILCASEQYSFASLIEDLPIRGTIKSYNQPVEILVSNLPDDKDQGRIRSRLKQLSGNCGGRVMTVSKTTATIRFSTFEFATRAQKRMEGEDVFGRKITVGYPNKVLDRERKEGSPMKIQSVRKSRFGGRNEDVAQQIFYSANGSSSYHQPVASNNLYHSTPAGLNVLSSIAVPNFMSYSPQNAWSRITNGNAFSAILSSSVQNQENTWFENNVRKTPSAEQLDFIFTKENSRNLSPLAGSWSNSKDATEELKLLAGVLNNDMKTYTSINRNVTRTPEGYRRIRGNHRVSVGDENANNDLVKDQHMSSNQGFPSNILTSRNIGPYTRPQGQIMKNGTVGRKCRTPSPYTISGFDRVNNAQNRSIAHSTSSSIFSDTEHELDNYFHPIPFSKAGINGSVSNNASCNNPVELQVSNLDQNIDPKELKKLLLSVFREHVMVLHVSVFMQSDGNYAAHVKVPSLQDAQYAISQLHRRKVGYKRILISYANNGGPSPQLIRSQIISLLLEVPGHRLPLFKFRELFESRYLTSVSISDMYKMKDVCLITEECSGRMVTLNPDHRNTPSPCFSSMTEDGQAMELPYCTIHPLRPGPDKGWAELEMGELPNVRIGLKKFAMHIHTLLQTHNGSLPLPSLPNCYETQIEKLAVDATGVPLEHLVSCLPGIEIYQGVGCVKYLRWQKSKTNGELQNDDPVKCVSPPLATQLALFSRELVDLLKTSTHCQLLFNRFIPAYHHHFGRQCRVADYGFTKLIDLMEALPHIVQVMGEGNNRVVTLSHKAQVRRFTSDLLRVLKSQASKQVMLSEFPSVYQRVLGRQWDVVDYGVCEIGDLLIEVSENTVVISATEDGNINISIPKREQTQEEIEKTKQFAEEVVELLQHAPQCSILFNKFIPAYHHHYGHQCRVADYGFTKLIELFEAVPHVAKLESSSSGPVVTLVDHARLQNLSLQARRILMNQPSGRIFLEEFIVAFWNYYKQSIGINQIEKDLTGIIQIVKHNGRTIVELTPMQIFANNVYHMLFTCDGQLPLSSFESTYLRMFGVTCQPTHYGHMNLISLLMSIPETVTLQSRGNKKILILNKDLQLAGIPLPANYMKQTIAEMDSNNFFNEDSLSQSAESMDQLTVNGEKSSPLKDSKTDFPEPDYLADKFLKSVLGNGSQYIFDSPKSPKAESTAKVFSEKPCKPHQPLICGALWGGASPPHYAPYSLSPRYTSFMNGFVSAWPKPPSASSDCKTPIKTVIANSTVPTNPFFQFPSGCLPYVVPPDPSELPLPQLNGSRLETKTSPNSEVDAGAHVNGKMNGDSDVESSNKINLSMQTTDANLENSNVSYEAIDSNGTPNKTKCKRRLAAQFNTPIQIP